MTSSSPPSPDAHYPLRVARVVDETRDARSIVFEIPTALAGRFRYEAGQFLTLSIVVDGVRLKRCYSFSSSPARDREAKITVKRVQAGRASNWLNDHIRAGDVLDVQVPAGRFVLHPGAGPLVFFAGGSGITPVISIVKTALLTTAREVRLVYANRDEQSVIFAAELAELARTHGARLSTIHRLDSREGPIAARDVAAAVVPDATYYLCGPGPFMELVENALAKAGVPAERVHVERFVSAADSPPPERAAAPAGELPTRVSIELEGAQHEVPYLPGSTLLESALAAGVDAPYSCREGFCGSCTALLVEGKVTMDAEDALTEAAKKKGLVLACQARPTTQVCSIRFVDY